jgi:hypothetical protein
MAMDETALRRKCRARGLSAQAADGVVAAIRDLEAFARGRGKALESLDQETLQDHICVLIERGLNSPERLRALLDGTLAAGMNQRYVQLIGLLSGREVIPSIAGRLEQLAGPEVRASVFDGLELPPLGSSREAYPPVTQAVVTRLRTAVPEELLVRVLAANHHNIPAERFAPLRAMYLESGLDAVLAHRHKSLVQQLEAHAESGEPWHEQLVTPAFVKYVRGNQEIGAGVRAGNRIHFAKVPYAPQEYLDAKDLTMKRYYQCHCPLARESILRQDSPVDPVFCYCSGGFAKVAFEVIFAGPVEVEVLESALAGDTRCRFAITIPH